MSQLVEVFVSSLAPASLYALLGVGFVLIFRATRAVNFLQGNFLYIGALVFVAAYGGLTGNLWLALLISLCVGALVGGGTFFVAVKPVSDRGVLTVVIVTLVLGLSVMSGITNILFGLNPRYFDSPLSPTAIDLPLDAHITPSEIATIVTAVVFIGGLALFLRFSRFGIAMRAGAENPRLAGLRGVSVPYTSLVAWSIGGVASTLAGVAYATQVPVTPNMQNLGLYVFPAVLIGGMDSVGGVLVGSLIFALVSQGATTYIDSSSSDLVAALMTLLILAVRPYGLFGTPEYKRL